MCGGKLKCTLHYFDVRGKGEAIRIMMNYMDCDYTEKIISMEEWPKLKGTYPGGQLPVVDFDCGCEGQKTMLIESDAILMKLAKYANVAGDKDHVSVYRTMVVFGICNDMQSKYYLWFTSPDGEKPATLTKILDELLPPLVKKLEGALNGRGFAGDEFCVADIKAYSMLEKCVALNPEYLKTHSPKLQAFYEDFPNFAGDKVKKYIQGRRAYAMPI